MIEMLLPAVWDEAYAYGMPRADTAPDPDMPKGWTNKSHGNTHYAYIADIKTGWAKAPLTRKERRSLFMSYALDMSDTAIGKAETIDRSVITHRLFTGVGKVMATLNGGVFSEEEIASDDDRSTSTQ